ncbi:MAG: FAD-dependent oxidoreductase [Opitutaceae bacterium]|jgi:glycine/D-amino acid oxidase-like deaminating enzyme|nr:FAD-dependent oxidoreductase [Opitutaceae bacterium]
MKPPGTSPWPPALALLLPLLSAAAAARAESILVEAESFANHGGWVVDNESMLQMGSPYLMAHGLGAPVRDATTTIHAAAAGEWRVWVRTRDWVAPWGKTGAPGRFQLLADGAALPVTFGAEGADWHWQDGGAITLRAGENTLALRDLTGFNARCDAIFLTNDPAAAPPAERPRQPVIDAGGFDLVVAGGGLAGCCAALSAARLGCKVALIQNRPVLGGNNSSEIRVGASGRIEQQPYPRLGYLMDELNNIGRWNIREAKEKPAAERSRQITAIAARHPEKHIHNGGPASNYDDARKERLIRAEPNITLFLNTQADAVETAPAPAAAARRITAIIATNILTGERLRFRAKLFADCTGDATIGFLAGADWREGRESRAETAEPRAPAQPDRMVMGASVQWYAEDAPAPVPFPACPWAIEFDERTAQPGLRGDWKWETGMNRDQVAEIERIRDHGLRAVFGNWDFLKNRSEKKADYAGKQLAWVAHIAGKRESRRLLGDVILREQDILDGATFPDGSFTTTWGVDLHFPKPLEGMTEEPFLAISKSPRIKPLAVPYRCLYSRNIENLFMAGRNISVTHVALGTVRVMRTGGMMGEVVGMAASLCKKHTATPRQIYQRHLDELKSLMTQGVGKPGFPED